MKHFKNFFISIATILSLVFANASVSFAAETPVVASYDLNSGGTQIFYLQDQDGTDIVITIEEISGHSRIANGSYKVTYNNPLLWEAGFTVDITSNKISHAHSAFYSVSIGSLTNHSLTVNSSTKTTYKFMHKAGLINTTTGVIATISGTSLNVSKL